MKTKNKLLALVEIAIVLCSVFLVALPAIAAQEQNQEMQKVSASANTITTASEDDYVLDVYGNANEDDTIDMRDLTYVKLIFFGKKPETELADAKYDGKINPLDFIQIKLIIVGKEKEITIVDSCNRIVTVKKPVKRIILINSYCIDPLRALNVADKIVGVTDSVSKKAPREYFGELCDLPCVGTGGSPDYEVILSLEPDLVIYYALPYYDTAVDMLKSIDPNLPILRFGCGWSAITALSDEPRKLGYIFDRKDEAEECIDWFEGIIDTVKARTEKLSDDEKPRVFYGSGSFIKEGNTWYTYGKGSGRDFSIKLAGGRNIAADLPSAYMDLEWVIEQNPEIIFRSYYPGTWKCYEVDDMTEIIAKREEVLNHPALAEVAAVKDERVLLVSCDLTRGLSYPVGIAYMAKWFHPDIFEDLDPKAIHQEFLTEFQRLDYDLDKHGVFVYPEPS